MSYQGTIGCVPKNCVDAGAQCGPASDGCGGTLYCGICQPPQICKNGKCVNQGCTPVNCSQQGWECGSAPDGCGGVVHCGGCPNGKVCGAAGPNKCGIPAGQPTNQKEMGTIMSQYDRSGFLGEYQDQDLQNFAAEVAYAIGLPVVTSDVLKWLNDHLPSGTQAMKDVYKLMGRPDPKVDCENPGLLSKMTCLKNARLDAIAWVANAYQHGIPGQINLCPTCAQRGVECGTVPADSKCPSPTVCGSCGANFSCVNGKCLASKKMPHNKTESERRADSRTLVTSPFDPKTGKPLFPNQPLIQALLEAMFPPLSLVAGIPSESKTYNTIASWIITKAWKTILDAYQWAGMTPECTATPAQCTAAGTTLFNKLRDVCVQQYVTDYAKGLISKDQTLNPPAVETASSAWAWILGIGGVLAAVGGTAYYLNKKKNAPLINPAGRKLRTEIENDEVEQEVRSLAEKYAPEADQVFPVFEHGQWWVTVSPDPDDPSDPNSEATYSVIDTSRGLDLERI